MESIVMLGIGGTPADLTAFITSGLLFPEVITPLVSLTAQERDFSLNTQARDFSLTARDRDS